MVKYSLQRIVRDCFSPDKQGKRGLREVRPNIKRAEKHLEKANHNLGAMVSMYEEEYFDWTIVCGYYAIYHAVLAALILIGIRAFTHQCATACFELFYINKGKIAPKYQKYLKRAKRLEEKYVETIERAKGERVTVQYDVTFIEHKESEWILKASKEFVKQVEKVVAETKGV